MTTTSCRGRYALEVVFLNLTLEKHLHSSSFKILGKLTNATDLKKKIWEYKCKNNCQTAGQKPLIQQMT